MAKNFEVDVVNEIIAITPAFTKKLNAMDAEICAIYKKLKDTYPTFKFVAVQKVAPMKKGNYDHTTMKDILSYLETRPEWKKEFEIKFGAMEPNKRNACQTVRKAKFVTIRAWFVAKRKEEVDGQNSALEKCIAKGKKGKAAQSEAVVMNTASPAEISAGLKVAG